jgi:hypothetical protein
LQNKVPCCFFTIHVWALLHARGVRSSPCQNDVLSINHALLSNLSKLRVVRQK